MISIKNINISYSNNFVINDLSLEISEGRIHGIVGLNGTGKTTLLNAIYGLKSFTKGEILNDGQKINKKELTYLVTENYFYSNITGREYLRLFKNKTFDIEKWNKLFSLPLDKIIDTYSTGMKKKLALLGVLKQDKPVMLLDEPFSGLDIETNRIVRSILLRLKEKGKTIVVTSHILETLTNLCDVIHYLENKRIKYSKEKDEFEAFKHDLFEKIENENNNIISDLIQ